MENTSTYLIIYLIPLVFWWGLTLYSWLRYGEGTASGDAKLIAGIFNVISFIPLLNYYLLLICLIEVSKKVKKEITDL